MMPSALIALPGGPVLQAIAGGVVGILLGLVHFGTLAWNARLYATGGAARALAVQLLRLAVLAGAFVLLALAGAPVLLGGALGLLVARHVVIRRAGGLP